uniref:Dimethylargininase n=1 Tax=Panagrolaimus sp. ES5 TaxID=591445 RepID=A0AC34F7L9_9BILA
MNQLYKSLETETKTKPFICTTNLNSKAGVDIIELAPDENSPEPFSLFPDDVAIVINGTALLTRPKKLSACRLQEIKGILKDLTWQIVEAPEQEHGKPVILEGSDVLFTGKEIFVGIRKNGTNIEGAVAADGVLTTTSEKESVSIRTKMEREAAHRYKVLTLEKEEAVNCISVNNHLIFRTDVGELKFGLLERPTELWGITATELSKIGYPISKFCLLVKKIKSAKSVMS